MFCLKNQFVLSNYGYLQKKIKLKILKFDRIADIFSIIDIFKNVFLAVFKKKFNCFFLASWTYISMQV